MGKNITDRRKDPFLKVQWFPYGEDLYHRTGRDFKKNYFLSKEHWSITHISFEKSISLMHQKSLTSLRFGCSNLRTRPLASNNANSPQVDAPIANTGDQRF